MSDDTLTERLKAVLGRIIYSHSRLREGQRGKALEYFNGVVESDSDILKLRPVLKAYSADGYEILPGEGNVKVSKDGKAVTIAGANSVDFALRSEGVEGLHIYVKNKEIELLQGTELELMINVLESKVVFFEGRGLDSGLFDALRQGILNPELAKYMQKYDFFGIVDVKRQYSSIK